MKFKIGDRVRVKSKVDINATLDDSNHARYPMSDGSYHMILFADDMYNYCGKVYTVLKICENETYKFVDRSGGDWNFIDDWLEEYEEPPCYVSSFTDEPRASEKEEFIDKILDLEEEAELCLDSSCSDCSIDDCIVYDLLNAIKKYKG